MNDTDHQRTHLDDDTVAGWLEGTLPPDERERAREHVRTCPGCHALVGASAPDIAPRAVTRGRSRTLAIAAAAVVVVGVGVMLLLSKGDEAPDAPLTDALLASAAADLRTSSGALAGFEPLTPAERRQAGPDVERGGLQILSPRHGVLDARPTLMWTPVAGASRYRVTLRGEDGMVLLGGATEVPGLAWPRGDVALTAGRRFVLSVIAETPTGEVRGGHAFHMLGAADAERYRDGDEVLRTRAHGDALRKTLRAHWAIRQELWHVADALMSADATGADPSRETRALIDRMLGRTP